MQVRDLYLMISDLTDGGQILGHISYGTPGHSTARDTFFLLRCRFQRYFQTFLFMLLLDYPYIESDVISA